MSGTEILGRCWPPRSTRPGDEHATRGSAGRADVAPGDTPLGEGAHLDAVGRADALARLEARIFFEELFQRTSDIRLVRPGEKIASYWFSGYASLPVRWS